MSGEETSFIQWRERAKEQRKSGGVNTAVLIGVAVAALVLIVVVAILLLH